MKRTALLLRWRWLLAVIVTFALAPRTARAVTGTIDLDGAKIAYTNATSATKVGNDVLLKFTDPSQVGSFALPGFARANVLVVGGGGAGGSGSAIVNTYGRAGAGGGGGGASVLITNDHMFASGLYTVTVGAGGTKPASVTTMTPGEDGKPTTLRQPDGSTLFTAAGGGGGGSQSVGNSGANGGGGSMGDQSGRGGKTNVGGTPDDPDTGFAGGSGNLLALAGGGGGAGGAGLNANNASGPNGGPGLTSSITGSSVAYGVGGGGGCFNENKSAGTGSADGNGKGGYMETPAKDGTAGLGNGGGGCSTGAGAIGGAGGCGGVYVRITMALPGPIVPPDPVEYMYDGNAKTAVVETAAWTVRDNIATNAGTYTATLTVKEPFSWDDGSKGDKTVTMTITQSTATKIANLVQPGWRVGTPVEETPAPSCTVTFGAPVTYSYGARASGEFSPDKPTEVGTWWVKATVAETANYIGVETATSFSIWDDPEKVFVDYVDYTLNAYTGTSPKELVNFPVKITLAEDSPKGFTYSRAGEDGENMAFTDAAGDPLPYEVASWNVNGESVVYVRVAKIANAKQTVRLHWRVKDGQNVPDHYPDQVWSDWEGPESSKYKPLAGKITATPDFVHKDGKIVNYWTAEPAMDKTQWLTTDATPGKITSSGKLAYPGSEIEQKIENSITHEVLPALPTTESGVYRVIFTQKDLDGLFETPERHIDFRITARLPLDDLSGGASNVTFAGRILLANEDKAVDHKITDQCYYQTERCIIRREKKGRDWVTSTNTYDVFWSHFGERKGPTTLPYLMAGSDHQLNLITTNATTETTNALWQLRNVFIGNTLLSDLKYGVTKCFLPMSPTGLTFDSFTNTTTAAGRQQDAAHLVLLNLPQKDDAEESAIYSPVYSNGIGTVYFDAVNAWNNNRYYNGRSYGGKGEGDPCYGLALEVTTDGGATWVAQEIHALRREGTAAFVAEPATTDFILDIATGGSADNFYRVYAPVNIRGTVRFRIRRTHVDSNKNATGNAYILLDNLIVSYPEMTAELDTYGTYDKSRTGEQVVGQVNAMMTPFPSILDAELLPRAKTKNLYASALTNADPATFIQLARLHYRWRYLDQVTNDWQTIDLNDRVPGAFSSPESLDFPRREGDIEYWLESFVQLPFYSYYDYSGKGLYLLGEDGAELYTEEHTAVTNRLKLAAVEALPSGGRDWFMRLRRGKSDYMGFRVLVKDAEGNETPYEAELVGDHCWRVYFRTTEAVEDGLDVRFIAYNRQTPGSEEVSGNETKYRLSNPIADTPHTETLEPGEDWTKVVCDAVTGWLVFQIDDRSLSVTLAHADYQDFNRWSDANKGRELFVGTSTDTNAVNMSGSSSKTRDFPAGLEWWHPSTSTNPKYWREEFTNSTGYVVYEPFNAARSPNGMLVGPGQWVYSNYRDAQTGLALQMEGKGHGYIQFVNDKEAPRGLESICFKARLGQAIEFGDISYFDGGDKTAMKEYTFLTRAAFDTKQRGDFSGNGSLSLVACHRPGLGCYEFRVEQENATKNGTSWKAGGNLRLSLYRWDYDPESGEILPKPLGTRTVGDGGALKTNGDHGTMSELFISVYVTDSQTFVCAGMQRGMTAITTTSGTAAYSWVGYTDKEAPASSGKAGRFTCGSYGVVSANCPGRFLAPLYSTSATKDMPSGSKTLAGYPDFQYNDSSNYTIPATPTKCQADLEAGKWAVMPRRMEPSEIDDVAYGGLKAVAPKQTLNVYMAATGTDTWTLLKSIDIDSFGDGGVTTIPLYSVEDCSLKLAPGGTDRSARNDVVIDDIEFRQWRGEHYDDKEGAKYFDELGYGSPSNVVFTQAWIVTNATGEASCVTNCQLNAKRSKTTVATSIRSPLLDGRDGRGLGLGMVSFTFGPNADTNVNLLVQIATNGLDITMLDTFSKSVDKTLWTTVTNFSFAALSEKERKEGGLRTCYLGLHETPGVMRIVMDPELVKKVRADGYDGPFGAVDVTGVMFRDEPAIDKFAWWGWNIRTTDENAMMSLGDRAAQQEKNGMSLGLNDSVTDKIDETARDLYPEHLPFVQTPVFGSEVVGEVSFRARKYHVSDPAVRLTLFGAKMATAEDDQWVKVASWDVTSETFSYYTFKTTANDSYRSFRFAVTGVEGVRNPMPDPDKPKTPLRVLIDDVLVMETVFAKVGFRNVLAFRSDLDKKTMTPVTPFDVRAMAEQPLCKESWGVQAEIYAAQLPEEIDLSSARVRLWWYEGRYPWGFESWRNSADAKKAWLAPCEDMTNVFKSTYFGAAEAVMPPQQRWATVQYMLEVQYKSNGRPATNWLGRADWPTPSWYSPIDYNVGAESFSAFNILDTVAPGWAWINEVNVYGEMDDDYENSDKSLQFVEIGAPAQADLSDWTIRFLFGNSGMKTIAACDVARFGSGGLSGLKKDLKGMDTESECVFHVVGSPWAKTNRGLNPDDGRLDGTWSVTNYLSSVGTDGEVQRAYPLAVQLVRPSGIIAHELVAIGTNRWAYLGGDYLPENQVEMLNADERSRGGHGNFFYVGEDSQGIGTNGLWSTSLGATRNNGLSVMDWSNTMGMTPGRINEFQVISGKPPQPQGSSIVIYSMIEGDHLLQDFGESFGTNGTVAAVVTKGTGTNVTYHADRWYQVASVETNGVTVATPAEGTRELRIMVGKNVSNDFTVVARASVDTRLERDYGLGPDNRYRAAVLDWLGKGRTKRGEFANVNDGLVGLAEFHKWDGTFSTNMTLTSMYWLDMDPTWNDGDLWLRGGISAPTPVPQADGTENVRMTVNMMITNCNEAATDKAWAPYILQGMDPAFTSWDYAKATKGSNWSNETFKITGLLVNGSPVDTRRENWIPLRWFVFAGGGSGSLVYSSSFDEDFGSVIDIVDPHSPDSPGHSHHWDDYPDKPVWNRWDLDNRLVPFGVEILKPENKLSE